MNIRRKEAESKELNDILTEINTKYGLTEGNNLVAREMTRIYNKLFNRSIILAVKKEAALRVLYGQEDRNDVFGGIKIESIYDKKYNFN